MDISKVILFKDKKIGLSISGGADSALLAFYLLKNIDSPIHFFTYASEEKQNRTVKNSLAVIEKCLKLTGKTDVYHHIKYGKTQDRDQFFNYLTESINNGIVDIIYTGTTSIPPNDVIDTFEEKLEDGIKERRNPLKKKSEWSHSFKLYHPFINIDKKDIAKIYKDLDLLDELYPKTNSCESFTQLNGHCERCWWCQERLWAFEK